MIIKFPLSFTRSFVQKLVLPKFENYSVKVCTVDNEKVVRNTQSYLIIPFSFGILLSFVSHTEVNISKEMISL